MTHIAHNVWRHAAERPQNIALREGLDEAERQWTYHQLAQAISITADEYRARGIGSGDRVLFVLPTAAEFVIAYYALQLVEAIAVTVNPLSAPRELDYFIEDAGATLAVAWREEGSDPDLVIAAAEKAGIPTWILEPGSFGRDGSSIDPDTPLAEIPETPDETPAALLYTSGTTGTPKGAVITHGNLNANGRLYSTALEIGPEDRSGTSLPLFHVFAQGSVMQTALTGGASLTLIRPFHPAVALETIVKHGLTGMSGVPTMWNAMVHTDTPYRPEDFHTFRFASSGGAALPVEVAKKFSERFGAEVLEGYGLTETTGAGTYNAHGAEQREGSVGKALPEVDLAVLDDLGNELPPGEIGEIGMAGPVIATEYWNRPDATEASRSGPWFLTGDIGRIDEDGFVYIVDRKKDLIIRGGYNVYPREIEEVLYGHPDVIEAAVAGVPDDHLGEEIAAVVTLREGAEIDAFQLRAWLSEFLAPYKVPRIYQFVPSLPKGATGKILKRAIDRHDLREHGISTKRDQTPTAS